MTRNRKNMGSGATIFLALVAAGVVTVGKSAQQQTNSVPFVVIAVIAALLIYIYKIKK